MFIDLIKKMFRKVHCDNFDCSHEWDGVCRCSGDIGLCCSKESRYINDLTCVSFRQAEG